LQKKEAQRALEEAARSRRRRRRNIVEHLYKPRREVMQILKAKSSWLDVRDVSELEDVMQERGRVEYKVVYGYWLPKLQRKEQQ
jgi:hypothetical protein